MILHILDLKQYMYTGLNKPQVVSRGVIEDGDCYRPREFRCGSLAYVIDEIAKIMKDKKNVICICIDTIPTIKREMSMQSFNRQYKGGRQKAPEHVSYQFKFATEMFERIGFNCIKIDGYEADDCIASVIRKYQNYYEKIVIHSNDSDQYYLVTDKISIAPTSLKGKVVNRSNYETVSDKNRLVPYNTMTVNKLIHGDIGDGISPAPVEQARKVIKLIPPVVNRLLGDNDILRTLVKNSCSEDESTMATFDLIAPIEITEGIDIDNNAPIDWELLRFFGIEFQSYTYARYDYMSNEVGEEMITDFLSYLEGKGVI